MHRPEKLNEDGAGGLYVVPNAQLNQKVAKSIAEHGYYYFTDGKEVLDAFGLAFEKNDTKKAIDKFVSFTKQLHKWRCDLARFGFDSFDKDKMKLALTYTIQSKRFDNQPLWIEEKFDLQVPLIMIVNQFASLWSDAYDRRPEIEILKVVNGK